MALAQITLWTIQHSNTKAAHLIAPTNLSQSSINDPDVYYIILDAYSRDDVLQEDLGFDNSDFISNMKAMGFVFPACTRRVAQEIVTCERYIIADSRTGTGTVWSGESPHGRINNFKSESSREILKVGSL